MKTLYVVTRGRYSDYSVVGIFDKKEKAQKFIEAFQDKESYDSINDTIEEYWLNPLSKELESGKKLYRVVIHWSGNVQEAELEKSSYDIFARDGFDINKNLYVRCWARDKDHAIKIANERRAILKSEEITKGRV